MRFSLVLWLISSLLIGCGRSDPFLIPWTESPTEKLIFALDRDELNRASAFSVFFETGVVIEDPVAEGNWDFAVERQGDQMVILPARALGVEGTAAVVPLQGTTLTEVREAPRDTLLYISDQPIPVDLTTIYVVRSNERFERGFACIYYGKIQPLEVDLEAGTFRFLHDGNPNCNNRSLTRTR